MPTTRTAALLSTLLLAAIAGCGGGGGEPTVSQSVHDLLQHELDETLAKLEAEQQAKAKEAAARETAQAQAKLLTGQRDTALAEAARLEGELTTALAEAARLEGVIGNTADTASNAADASLHAQLNAAKAEVTRLEGVIGAAGDTASAAMTASLHAQLNAAKAEVTRLEGVIGDTADAANADGSLYAQLNAAKAEAKRLEGVIGSTADRANAATSASLHAQLNAAKAEVTRLQGELTMAQTETAEVRGQLNAANADVRRLEGEIGTTADPANPATSASLHAQLNAAKAKVTELQGVIGDTGATAGGSLNAQLNAAKAEVTRLRGVIGTPADMANAATDASLNAQLKAAKAAEAKAKDDLTKANARVTSLTAELEGAKQALATTRETLTTTRTERDTAQEEAEQAQQREQARQQEAERLQEQLTEAEQAELSARATSFNAVLDDSTAGMVMISWPRGGSLTFRPEGTLTPGSAAPSVPGNWRRTSFTGQTGTATSLVDETVYLYTNIQKAGTRAFWKKYGGEDVAASTVATGLGTADGRTKPSTSVSRTRSDPTDSSSAYVSATTGGSFDGVGGKFSCSGDETACTVTRSDGTTTMLGDWTFKANSLTSGVPVDQDDAYLYFGIWSSIPVGLTGTYDFDYISGGGAVSSVDLTGFATLKGPATFRGGAVGRYVTLARVGQNAKIGTFTATATLNADFSTDAVAGTLSGSITDFREGGSSLAGWRVTLGGTSDVGASAPITLASGDDVTGVTVANIGGLPVGGSWGANFHGSANTITGLDDRDKYPAVDLAGVTGWFDATGTDASLAGAFGAQ